MRNLILKWFFRKPAKTVKPGDGSIEEYRDWLASRNHVWKNCSDAGCDFCTGREFKVDL